MQTLTEMAQAVGLPRKPFYTLTETAKATGISYSTLIRASWIRPSNGAVARREGAGRKVPGTGGRASSWAARWTKFF